MIFRLKPISTVFITCKNLSVIGYPCPLMKVPRWWFIKTPDRKIRPPAPRRKFYRMQHSIILLPYSPINNMAGSSIDENCDTSWTLRSIRWRLGPLRLHHNKQSNWARSGDHGCQKHSSTVAIMALPVLSIDEVGHADDATSNHSFNNGASQGYHEPVALQEN